MAGEFKRINDLSRARILVTNDDGIYAPGLKVLEEIARSLSDDVWVIAPEVEQSGAGHSLSLSTPLRYLRLDERRFAVRGTPTDSVLMAVRALVGNDKPIDLVLSGVNRGPNLAEDVTHSGTIAAAMEGTLSGIPSIAFSQAFAIFKANLEVQWNTARTHAPAIIRDLVAQPWPKNTMVNVNFPDLPPEKVSGVKLAFHGRRDARKEIAPAKDPLGRLYYWLHWGDRDPEPQPGSDLQWQQEGYITVTPLELDLTDYKQMEVLRPNLDKEF